MTPGIEAGKAMKRISWEDGEDYPSIIKHTLEGWSPDVFYQYVPSDFLNSLAWHWKPLKAFVVERYRAMDLDKCREIMNAMTYHPDLASFEDDVHLLMVHPEKKDTYAVFEFDCDVSDCAWGYFVSSDPQQTIADFEGGVRAFAQEYSGTTDEDGRETSGLVFEIPIDKFVGIPSF